MLLATKRGFIAACVVLAAGLWHSLATASAISLPSVPADRALGEHTSYYKETATPLSLADALIAHASGKFTPSDDPILSFGIGSQPVWIHLSVSNPTQSRLARRVLIENSWLDRVDIYFISTNKPVAGHSLGDAIPFGERPIRERFLSVQHSFEPGHTDIFLRVQTPDPIVVPLFLLTQEEAAGREQAQGYSYGFLYGYLIALLAYNVMLYLSLRHKRHLLYAVFIAMFVTMNFGYTGHGFAWLWPEHVALQRWIVPILIVLFAASGLAFAANFLNTQSNFPRAHKTVTAIAAASMLLVALPILFADDQFYALLVAFVFVTFFSFAMLALGIMSFYTGYKLSHYFILASLASMIGTAITSLSVLGLIPFDDWKFRAVEGGMLVDATLLALALAGQVRAIQIERVLSEERATRDPLTGLHNRRSFLEKAQPIWSVAQRNARDLSMIMLDLDHFKSINDRYGHDVGDSALVATAKALEGMVREGDIVARWGGEEFLVLLPETKLEFAVALAERLQTALAEIRLPSGNAEIRFTASFGVAHKQNHKNEQSLISEADQFLYQSKNTGRNKITSALG